MSTSLRHEARDDAVERAVLVAEGLAHPANTTVTGGERNKVGDGLGGSFAVETKNNPAGLLVADLDVKEHLKGTHKKNEAIEKDIIMKK
jgi:hypothetical protein